MWYFFKRVQESLSVLAFLKSKEDKMPPHLRLPEAGQVIRLADAQGPDVLRQSRAPLSRVKGCHGDLDSKGCLFFRTMLYPGVCCVGAYRLLPRVFVDFTGLRRLDRLAGWQAGVRR